MTPTSQARPLLSRTGLYTTPTGRQVRWMPSGHEGWATFVYVDGDNRALGEKLTLSWLNVWAVLGATPPLPGHRTHATAR